MDHHQQLDVSFPFHKQVTSVWWYCCKCITCLAKEIHDISRWFKAIPHFPERKNKSECHQPQNCYMPSTNSSFGSDVTLLGRSKRHHWLNPYKDIYHSYCSTRSSSSCSQSMTFRHFLCHLPPSIKIKRICASPNHCGIFWFSLLGLDMIEGSLNSNFRQYGELKSRDEKQMRWSKVRRK